MRPPDSDPTTSLERPAEGLPAPQDPRREEVCPVCAGTGTALLWARDRNRAITPIAFRYYRCTRCDTVFLGSVPADLARYYEASYYLFGDDGEPAWKAEPARTDGAAYRVELLRRHVRGGHLIEIGAGTGAFAVAARDAGFEVSAIEMNERCCEYLDGQEGITAVHSDRPVEALRRLPDADVVVSWHALEHLSEPAAVLEAAAGRLKEGGALAVTVPNPGSLQFRVLKRRWMHLDAPRHLCLIPARTLVAIGGRLGLVSVAELTTDPEGLECDLVGWINALSSDPASGSGSWLTGQLGGAIWRAAAPLERSGNRGSAITLVMLKEPRRQPDAQP